MTQPPPPEDPQERQQPASPSAPPSWPPATAPGTPPAYPSAPGYPPGGAYPPGPAYPGGWGPPPVTPRKSRRKLWITLAVVFVLVASCSTFVGIKVFHAEQGARQAANAFLDDMERGDTQAALARTCPGTTESDLPHVTAHKLRGFNITKGGGKTTARITYDLTFASTGEERDVLYLEEHDGQWLVCGAEQVR